MEDILLKVPHYDKLNPVGVHTQINGLDIIYHRGTKTQVYKDTPGGIDDPLLAYMCKHGITEFHHYFCDRRKLYKAVISTILDKTKFFRENSGGRQRVFLKNEFWNVSNMLLDFDPPGDRVLILDPTEYRLDDYLYPKTPNYQMTLNGF